MAACDDGNGAGGSETPNLDLNGTWTIDRSVTIRIEGSTGVITQIGSSNGALTQNAIDKGYFKVGTTYFRNLSKTGERTWTGQSIVILKYPATPTVAEGIDWTNDTITMSADGKTIYQSGNTWKRI
jgi:hypothetical protein